jgi:hypothetical protein
MALVQISDVVVPEVFTAYMLKGTMEKAGVFTSGLVKQDGLMATLLAGGGRLFQHPFWGDLDNTGSEIADDDPTHLATPAKITATKMQFIRQFRTRAWSSANLSAELAGDNPMARIVSRVSEYWAREFNRLTIATINGIVNDNIANDAGDMVFSAGVGVGGAAPTDGVTAEAVLETKQTMGDAAQSLQVIVMHSRIYTNLQQQQLIVFIPNARGEINVPTYLGYRVVVSDTVPVSAGVYTTYLAAPGVVGYAESPPPKPVETRSEPLQGYGAGVEIMVTRRQFSLHPYGWNFTDASTAVQFPTTAELELAANWDRKYAERKQVPIAVLLSTAA